MTTNYLKLLEMYPAVQGEGTLIGQPSTFVRLAGCLVGCAWCDTKYSWKVSQGEVLTPEDIYRRAKEVTTHGHIVLTGGEPLEQPEGALIELIRLLQLLFHVTIETSGTHVDPRSFIPKLRASKNLLWSISPKLSSARAKTTFPDLNGWLETSRLLGHGSQIKLVIGSDEDLEEAQARLTDVYIPPETAVILQPMTNTSLEDPAVSIITNLRKLQERVVQSSLFESIDDVRVLPQLHAVIYGRKRGI